MREQKVYSEIHPFNLPLAKHPRAGAARDHPVGRAVVVLRRPTRRASARELFDLGVPVLGICYGVQLTALLLGGKVVPAERREYGRATVKIARPGELFHGFAAGEEIAVWMSHGDRVEALPAGFELAGESANCPAAAVVAPARKF